MAAHRELSRHPDKMCALTDKNKYSKSRFSQNTTNLLSVINKCGTFIIDNKLVLSRMNVFLEYLSENTSGWLQLKW
jgi:hypothetical protein